MERLAGVGMRGALRIAAIVFVAAMACALAFMVVPASDFAWASDEGSVLQVATVDDEDTLVHPNATLLESGEFGDDSAFQWEYYDDATLVVTGAGAMPDFESTAQPWNARLTAIEQIEVLDGITSIGDYAFANCWLANKVKIPANLTRIGGHAFQGTVRLKELAMPDTVTDIGAYAFAGSGIATCHISTQMTEIPDYAFAGSALSQVNMFSGIQAIGAHAFEDCPLDSIVIPSSVTTLGQAAYSGVKTTSPFTVPGSVASIPQNAFSKLSINGAITLAQGIVSVDAGAFMYTEASSISLPASLDRKCEASHFLSTRFAMPRWAMPSRCRIPTWHAGWSSSRWLTQ